MKLTLALLFLFVGCTAEKSSMRSSRYNYKVGQLVADKGEPSKIESNIIDERYDMYNYEDEVYQVDGDKVIAKFRNPKEKERDIQYWRHLLNGEYYKITKDGSDHSHGALFKLISSERGLTVYFNKTNGRVLRIGESMGGNHAK